MNGDWLEKCREYAARHGVVTVMHPRTRGEFRPTWNGVSLDCTWAFNKEWIVHEVAHVLTGRRSYPNYGLGTDPNSGIETEQVMSNEVCRLDEDVALVVTIALLDDFGCSDHEIRGYQDSYGMDLMSFEEQIEAWREAIRRQPTLTALMPDDLLFKHSTSYQNNLRSTKGVPSV